MIEQHALQIIKTAKEKNQYRTRKLNQAHLVQFNSNDYLGMAQHPDVIKSFENAANQIGVGSGGSPLLGGYHESHQRLEETLSKWLQQPKALLFSSGYMANLSALLTLTEPNDYIFQDELNHASLMDAGLYARTRFKRFKHANTQDLETQICKKKTDKNWIVTDGVFSVDGDIAPLKNIHSIAKKYNGITVLDDAHGIGILGKNGSGTTSHCGISPENIDITTGSLGLSIGGFGAFIAGKKNIMDAYIQKARGYIYSTAIPPALAEAAITSIQIIQKSEDKRVYLNQLIQYFRQCAQELELNLLPSITSIQPIEIGCNKKLMHLSNALIENGFIAGAVRPPTVPEGKARLRIALNVNHTKEQIENLLELIVTPAKAGIYKRHPERVARRISQIHRHSERSEESPSNGTLPTSGDPSRSEE